MSTDEYEAIPEDEWKELATTEITHLTEEEKDYLPRAWDEWIARVRRDAAREALDGLAREAMEAFKAPSSAPYPRSWAEMSGAVEWYRDAHYPEETP